MSETASSGTSKRYQDLQARVLSAVALAGISFVALAFGGWLFVAYVALLTAAMTFEWVRMAATGRQASIALWVIPTLAALAIGAFALAEGEPLAPALVLAIFGVGLTCNPRPLLAIGAAVVLAAGLSVLHLRGLEGGFTLVLWLVLCVTAADIGGYFIGRSVGGPKLWPAVSPKKTWSGALGSLALALVVATGFGLAVGGSIFLWLAFGALITCVALAGDLLESSAKRRCGTKDSGAILPGHGGLLDRFDGHAAVFIAFAAVSTTIGLPEALVGGYIATPL